MHSQNISCCYYFSEQDCRNNLKKNQLVEYPPSSIHNTGPTPLITNGGIDYDSSIKSGFFSDPGSSFLHTSKSVHYLHLIHFNVSSGSRCHTRVERNDAHHWQILLPNYVSNGVSPWVHVFSKTTAPSSLRTLCASIAQCDGIN
jgi:hypothetical protein